jgi:hypothetical protein
MHTRTVTRPTERQWHTTERTIDADGRQWTIGLTPAAGGATVALILWSDNVVRAHRRGPEPDMVRTALHWATNLLNGRSSTARCSCPTPSSWPFLRAYTAMHARRTDLR